MIEVGAVLRAFVWLKPVPGFVPFHHTPLIKSSECILDEAKCSFMYRNQICVFKNRRQLMDCKLYLVTPSKLDAEMRTATGLLLICDGHSFLMDHRCIDRIKLSSGSPALTAKLCIGNDVMQISVRRGMGIDASPHNRHDHLKHVVERMSTCLSPNPFDASLLVGMPGRVRVGTEGAEGEPQSSSASKTTGAKPSQTAILERSKHYSWSEACRLIVKSEDGWRKFTSGAMRAVSTSLAASFCPPSTSPMPGQSNQTLRRRKRKRSDPSKKQDPQPSPVDLPALPEDPSRSAELSSAPAKKKKRRRRKRPGSAAATATAAAAPDANSTLPLLTGPTPLGDDSTLGVPDDVGGGSVEPEQAVARGGEPSAVGTGNCGDAGVPPPATSTSGDISYWAEYLCVGHPQEAEAVLETCRNERRRQAEILEHNLSALFPQTLLVGTNGGAGGGGYDEIRTMNGGNDTTIPVKGRHDVIERSMGNLAWSFRAELAAELMCVGGHSP